ncbi:MAG TPA: tetratricopeptide repeat protein, partial [Burkholderiales bacterium]|nr:tetratricopeptide repeat protein [Burkholderiales bacterium]
MLPLCVGARAQSTANGNTRAPDVSGITTTNHPPLPAQPSFYWLAPEPGTGRSLDARARFARGAKLIDEGDFAAGLPLVQGADLDATPLAHYSRYYVGVALYGLRLFEEADVALEPLEDEVDGFLKEAVPLRRAEIALARGDADEAADLLDDLSDEEALSAPEEVLLRLGTALEAAGERDRAVKVYQRVYYEFPLSSQAAEAERGIERLQTPTLIPSDRFQLELNRAERLFAARRWAQARAAFASLAKAVDKDKDELIGLRLAECDFHLD